MKILIASSEAVPFAKTGGLADVAGALPLALEELGHEVALVLPKYKGINYKTTILGKNIKVFFIENDVYYNRPALYGDKTGDYPDNLDRFSYFCRTTLELLKEINFFRPSITTSGGIPPKVEKPDIIHCHDWQSALIPVYLKTIYQNDPFYKDIKVVFTIHNIGYQGLFPKEQFPKLGLDWSLFGIDGLEFYDKVNLLKGGIVFSDLITTVSPTYSKEIQTKEFGFGLEGLLNKRRDRLLGVLNGLDYSIWGPLKDKFIAKPFGPDNLEGKLVNKEALQKEYGLKKSKDIPLFGMVSRLAEQKGLDIFADAIKEFAKLDLQLIILGTGDLRYHQILEAIAKKYPKKVSLNLKFDDPLAHKIYASSDVFLMPSKYEPCGLGQMISFKYGTIPLVYKTGGLADTVKDFNKKESQGNGFVFDGYSSYGFMQAVKRTLETYKQKKIWHQLCQRAMKLNFSWNESARRYVELYKKA